MTDEVVKDFAAINFSEYSKSIREEQNLRKVAKSLYIFQTFKVQTILFLDYKKRNDRKIFHSNAKLIGSDLDIDEAFKSMHQSIMTKIKNFACED